MNTFSNYSVLVMVVLIMVTANANANEYFSFVASGNEIGWGTSISENTKKSDKNSSKDDATEAKVHEPHFRVDHKLVSFNLLSLDESPAKVMVYNNDYILLYTTTVSGSKNLGKRFDFSNVEKGSYYIVVKHKKNIYSKTIEM
ncbi:hypothetical protein [Zhouia amylolytica]|uniref:Secretion system C-terminal sorting domain-containing protein n=1 Tax=Zhouia amylolytica AD3 TaxID=1286632 RepID=W2UPG6_9FLAO|nr:hypothetical protein [Zhouia amylolytica]ETN95883.1 hypothetical protein P278_16050 [Zhouia amylolytica AD3]